MKRVKIKERLENALEAFFDDEKLTQRNALVATNRSSAARFEVEETESFSGRHRTLIKILKRTFLFLPGVFVLFFMSVAWTGFVILRPVPHGEYNLFLPYFITFVSGLMTFLGLGDWRKPKHLFIPLSIIPLSVVLGIIGSVTHGANDFPRFIDHYAAYFLPLAFILPFLTKGVLDSYERGTK